MTRIIERQGWEFVKDDRTTDRDKHKELRARQRALGRELRRMYDDVAKEPVPDEFVELLRRIDKRDGRGGRNDS
ncbi:MAG TPA: NepR family anti-sigma factor [Rhizomicrobium sp.]|nr:NepR family anti-sigma factor [Rhizomicrobium sp.]